MTQPGLLRLWLDGRPGWSVEVCEVDLITGGTYRFVMRGPEGAEMKWHGVYRGIAPPHRMVFTETCDDPACPGEALVTANLEEYVDRTRLTLTYQYESEEAQESVLLYPWDGWMARCYERLASFLSPAPEGQP